MQEQYNYYQNSFYNNAEYLRQNTEKETNKKQLKKLSLIIGISCLIMIGFTFVWASAFSYILKFFGFNSDEILKAIKDPYVTQTLQVVLSTLMFTVPFIVVFKISGYRISDTVVLSKPKKENVGPLILIGIGFCAFANISVSIAGSLFESFGIDYNVDFGDRPKGITGFLLSFIATAIIPALVEEFACRGLILGSLKKYGEYFAILASAVIFGLMHGNFQQIPFAFTVGLILGYITVKSGSLWIACLVHSLNNCVSVAMEYIFSEFSVKVQNLIYNSYLMFALLAAIVGLCWLFKRDDNALRLKKCDDILTEKEKHKIFFTSPLIIAFSAICIIEALAFFVI